jgi:hypothetical protein
MEYKQHTAVNKDKQAELIKAFQNRQAGLEEEE